jgi:hypothetical protein
MWPTLETSHPAPAKQAGWRIWQAAQTRKAEPCPEGASWPFSTGHLVDTAILRAISPPAASESGLSQGAMGKLQVIPQSGHFNLA